MSDAIVSDSSIGIAHSMPTFNGALWKFTHNQGIAMKMSMSPAKALLKHHSTRPMPAHAPGKSLAREIKMLSMNPSVFGNHYGVLGSS
jgi:hypothetical protein